MQGEISGEGIHSYLWHRLWKDICCSKMNAICILVSLAGYSRWELHKFDDINAFLHGDLEVYMVIPPIFGPTSVTNVVCNLRKALYGLKWCALAI